MKTTQITLEGFSRSEEYHGDKTYVALAWYATDGSGLVVRKATGLHDTLSEAYAEVKKLLNIKQENNVVDSHGTWPI